jgi:hypothetical protein
VIAETARIRRDLGVVGRDSELVRNLGVLTGHRADLIADRVRMINRLRDLMTSVFPALEREFDYKSCKGAVVLLPAKRVRTRYEGWVRHVWPRGCGTVVCATTPTSLPELSLRHEPS